MPTAADKLKTLLAGVKDPAKQHVTLTLGDWKQLLDATQGGADARQKLAAETGLAHWEANPIDPAKPPPPDLEVSMPAANAAKVLAAATAGGE